MKFQYSEKKVKLPANVHAYAEKKVMKLARYFEEDAEALVVFSVEKNRNKVELTVHGAGTWFRASESTSDMIASIDAAVGTIEGQIRKNKTRLARRLRQDAFTRTVEETSFAAEEPEEDLSIVRVKKFYMPALFGGLGVVFISRNWKIAIAPIVLMMILFVFVPALDSGTVGIMVPVGVLLTLLEARVMYKKNLL